MFKKILLPLDGSELAERAIEPAMTIAKQTNAELIMLTAFEIRPVITSTPSMGVYYTENAEKQEETLVREYLAEVMEKYEGAGVFLRGNAIRHNAPEAILNTAVKENVDLIVMSSHGRSGIGRWIMGSVTERVLQHASCPVLVIHDSAPIKNVLITLDGSVMAESAIEPGLKMSELFDADVTYFGVESPILVDNVYFNELNSIEHGLGDVAREDFYHRTEVYLNEAAAKTKLSYNIDVDVAVENGRVAPKILEYVEDNPIDLLVMATHGRSGLERWVYGSITEKVLRKAPCNILIVRPRL